MIEHNEAVQRLRKAGITRAADELAAYKNVAGDRKGWDGWVRKAFERPIIDVIWEPAE